MRNNYVHTMYSTDFNIALVSNAQAGLSQHIVREKLLTSQITIANILYTHTCKELINLNSRVNLNGSPGNNHKANLEWKMKHKTNCVI